MSIFEYRQWIDFPSHVATYDVGDVTKVGELKVRYSSRKIRYNIWNLCYTHPETTSDNSLLSDAEEDQIPCR